MDATHKDTAQSDTAHKAGVEQMFNLPNVLTFLRILLIPVYVWLFSTPTSGRAIAAAVVFGLAALTDSLDGYIARQRAQVTIIGRLFDPIADKCLVIAGLVLLVQFHRVDAWLAITLIVRELAVTGVRAAAVSHGLLIVAGTMGKYKVALQVIAIMILTLEGAVTVPDGVDLHHIGAVILYAALALSVVSAGQYLRDAWRALFKHGTQT